MKSMETLYKDIMASDDLRQAMTNAVKAGGMGKFLQAQGCEADPSQWRDFLQEKGVELSDEAVEDVSGGII